jgi:hypothetical protein
MSVLCSSLKGNNVKQGRHSRVFFFFFYLKCRTTYCYKRKVGPLLQSALKNQEKSLSKSRERLVQLFCLIYIFAFLSTFCIKLRQFFFASLQFFLKIIISLNDLQNIETPKLTKNIRK